MKHRVESISFQSCQNMKSVRILLLFVEVKKKIKRRMGNRNVKNPSIYKSDSLVGQNITLQLNQFQYMVPNIAFTMLFLIVGFKWTLPGFYLKCFKKIFVFVIVYNGYR